MMKLKSTTEKSDFAKVLKRDDLQRELSKRLIDARTEFSNALALETAGMAESLVPELRSMGRKIFGIENAEFDPEQEELIQTKKLAIAGDNGAIYSVARDIMEDDNADEMMQVTATALVCMNSIYVIKQHALDPATGPKEEEIVQLLEDIVPSVVPLIVDDLQLISRKSPFEKVKIAAQALLDQIE